MRLAHIARKLSGLGIDIGMSLPSLHPLNSSRELARRLGTMGISRLVRASHFVFQPRPPELGNYTGDGHYEFVYCRHRVTFVSSDGVVSAIGIESSEDPSRPEFDHHTTEWYRTVSSAVRALTHIGARFSRQNFVGEGREGREGREGALPFPEDLSTELRLPPEEEVPVIPPEPGSESENRVPHRHRFGYAIRWVFRDHDQVWYIVRSSVQDGVTEVLMESFASEFAARLMVASLIRYQEHHNLENCRWFRISPPSFGLATPTPAAHILPETASTVEDQVLSGEEV